MIKATSPILLNDVRYETGDILPVDANSSDEKQLLASGSAELVTEPVLSTIKTPEKTGKNPIKAEDYSKYSHTKLVGLARAKGIKADASMVKAELIEAIKTAPELPVEKETEVPAVTINEVNPTPQPE